MDDAIDAISTAHAPANHAFDRLRGELHAAAGPDRIAAGRTRDTIEQLRTRADYFRLALELYAGQPLGDWYATLSARHEALAVEIEAEAERVGIIGGEA